MESRVEVLKTIRSSNYTKIIQAYLEDIGKLDFFSKLVQLPKRYIQQAYLVSLDYICTKFNIIILIHNSQIIHYY